MSEELKILREILKLGERLENKKENRENKLEKEVNKFNKMPHIKEFRAFLKNIFGDEDTNFSNFYDSYIKNNPNKPPLPKPIREGTVCEADLLIQIYFAAKQHFSPEFN